MNPVRATDADRMPVGFGLGDDGGGRPVDPVEQQLSRILDLERERRIDDIGGGQAVMHPVSFRPELLGDGVDERGGVVVGQQLDLRDARRGRDPRGGLYRGYVLCRNRTISAQPSSAASSTWSQRASLPSSDQILSISGRE